MRAVDELNAANQGKGCLGKSQPDEPVFVLVGRDLVSGDTLRFWADRVEQAYQTSGTPMDRSAKEKVAEARRQALEMDKWPTKKLPD